MSGLSRFLFSLFLLALSITEPLSGHAQGFDTGEPKVKAQLIAEQESIQPGKAFWVALKLDIEPEWHVYWRNPGDSGMATRITWDIPTGAQAGPIVWPTPRRIEIPPLVNYGYDNQVLLLTQIVPPADFTGDLMSLKARADWLVCHEVCIPEGANLELNLPVKPEDPITGAWGSAFNIIRKKIPQPYTGTALVHKNDEKSFTLDLKNFAGSAMILEAYFFGGDAELVTHALNQPFTQSAQDLQLTIPYNTTTKDHPDKVEGDIWIRTPEGESSFSIDTAFSSSSPPVVETAAPITQAANSATPQPSMGIGLAKSLLLALLGGLLLNLMPCVFPVLSIKALGLVQKSLHGDKKQIIVGGLVYTLGVLASFGLMGVLLLLIKTSGHNVDWGMQLQSPVFVTIMALVLFVIGYTLTGAFTFGSSLMGLGQNLTHKNGHLGTFFTGALAVVVATPCTAPFMGGALFYAFTQPWYVALSVLLVLGLGLALPYLLICLYPQSLKVFPKPGIWMEHFKQFLAFPMFAAAIWLLWVLGQQVGPNGVLRAMVAMLVTSFTLWVWRSIQRDTHQNIWHYCKAFLVAMCVLYTASLIFDQRLPDPVPAEQAAVTTTQFEPYSAERLEALRNEGHPVFVNMTAAWCITCLANERNALSSDVVKKIFTDNNIAYLKGDWTNRDPAISAFLQQHQRNGVPLYVFYAPGQDGKILPQLLTEDKVLQELTFTPVSK
jgi:thiol:disulfide interchange protein